MSFQPAYVQANDGRLYKNPVVRGNEPCNWSLSWDQEEPPEIVIDRPNVTAQEAARLLASKGIHVRRLHLGRQHDRQTHSRYFLHFHGAVPVASITQHEGSVGKGWGK